MYIHRQTDGRTDRKGSWEAFFNFRYGKKKKKGEGKKMRKEKWAQHVCMRLLMVDSNMEEFAWREIYPFTDSPEIAFQPYDCLVAKVIQVCEIQNYRWLSPILQTTLTPTYTQLPTPRSRILPEKLTGPHLLKKLRAFYRTRRFITALTWARHISLSWAISLQTPPPSQSHILKIDFNIIPCPYVLHTPPISFFSIWSPK